MVPTDNTRLKIAVFIDFDNVEIGVKTTIGGQFDIGVVLEAIKERGEIVTKIAYSDWKRVGDYSRQLTTHAIRMVQRNFTPGGDKNGADITMALDALEMAFTHDHINAFVIVGGDSDFISLVEKLKQYDRKVIVVGGRQFTSATMQKNCHEFIAYENLVNAGRPAQRQPGRGGAKPALAGINIAQALPLVRRALKVLSEREVTPQLGLLKSTLLQLDSTFSEREYGAGSFRDFMEKVAEAGAVTLRHAGRSMLVEAIEDGDAAAAASSAELTDGQSDVVPASGGDAPSGVYIAPLGDAESTAPDTGAFTPSAPTLPPGDAVQVVRDALTQGNPRWPMYVRQIKQFLRNTAEGFDERRFGFASPVDLLRACQKDGILRIERDRQGVMRVFAGPALKPPVAAVEEPVRFEGLPIDVEEEPIIEAEVADTGNYAVPYVAEPVAALLHDDEEPPDSQTHFMSAIVEQAKGPKPPPSGRVRRGGPRREPATPSSTVRAPRKTAPVPKTGAAKPRARRPAPAKRS